MRRCSGYRFQISNDSKKFILYVPSPRPRKDSDSVSGILPEDRGFPSLHSGTIGEWGQIDNIHKSNRSRGR